MAFKTLQQLAVAGSVADADITAVASGSGAMHSAAMSVLASYFATKNGGTSGHVFGFLDGANTLSATQTLSIGTAATAADYLVLRPTDYAAGKPALYFSKEASALLWQVRLYDGTTVAGQLDVGLTLLNLTGAFTASGLGTFGTLTVTGLITYTGSPSGTINTGGGGTLDASVADYHQRSAAVNTTYTLQGGVAGKSAALALEITLSAGAVPTFTSVKFEGGIAPSPGNGRSLFGFIWNGTDWTGTLVAAVVS